MEWVVGIQVDANTRIFYVHMDDLKQCAPPDPEPSWPDVARGTSIVVSSRAPSTLAPTEVLHSRTTPGSAHQTGSVSTMENDVRASTINYHSEDVNTDTNTPPASVWDLQDAKCILSKNSECCIDVKGFRFFTMERLFRRKCTLNFSCKAAMTTSSCTDKNSIVYVSQYVYVSVG